MCLSLSSAREFIRRFSYYPDQKHGRPHGVPLVLSLLQLLRIYLCFGFFPERFIDTSNENHITDQEAKSRAVVGTGKATLPY